MTSMQWQALIPLLVLSGAGSLMLLMAAFWRQHYLVALTAGFASIVALMTLPAAAVSEPVVIAPLLVVDRLTVFFWALIAAATLAAIALCYAYFQRLDEEPEEAYGLLLLSAAGAGVLAASTHFVSLFLGLELLSVPLVILVGYTHGREVSVEAALKYLVLAGFATTLLLFGIALLFGATGHLAFADLAIPVAVAAQVYWLGGLALVFTGLAFKLSLVPLHFWTPDVYQGAPTPVTAFLSTVSKGAALMVLLRLSQSLNLPLGSAVWNALLGVTAASILAGNWLALRQDNLKRLLAYSSIAHMGYALAGLLAGGDLARETVGFYLAFYFATTLGAFGVLVLLSGPEDEVEQRQALRGLFWRRPWPALVLTLMLLSLAGVPLTGGFIGKFYVLTAGAQAQLWALMGVVIIGSAIGLFYYLRVILTLLASDQAASATGSAPSRAVATTVLLVLSVMVIWLGLAPAEVIARLAGSS
ncbi:NADH-quinone oxidoreductase subunit N [Marinobacteraceae bacterium S3BR75-40.1]